MSSSQPTGHFRISNVEYPNQVIDLSGSDTNPGNPIIGFHWHNGQNQKWFVRTSARESTFKSEVGSNTFTSVDDDKAVAGPSQTFLTVVWDPANDIYRIQVLGVNEYLVLRNGNDSTQIITAPIGPEFPVDAYAWKFTSVD